MSPRHAAFRKIINVCSRHGLSLIAASVQFPTLRFFYFYLDSKQLPLFAQNPFCLYIFFLEEEVLSALGGSVIIF